MKLELAKKQEYFNAMYIGLSQQGWKQSGREYTISEDGEEVTGVTCLYRGTGGRKCAFGHLIPDDEYHYDLEGTGVCGSQFASWFGGVLDEDSGHYDVPEEGKELRRFLAEAQRIHDNNSNPDEMRHQLTMWGEFNNLTIPTVE